MSQPFSLDGFFDDALERSLDDHDRQLWSAIREQTQAGKRFRPKLLLSMYEALGGTDTRSAGAVADAVELLHTAFVIHDDVIDDDVVRRGRPNISGYFSAHARDIGAQGAKAQTYGAAAGILAGDLALGGAIRGIAVCGAPPETLSRLFDLVDDVLHRSAAGELADVRVSFTEAELDDVIDIAAWKTSAYSFELPMQAAAMLAQVDDATVDSLGQTGRYLGIAFQLIDDLDGVFASADQTGKDPLSDLREGKFTGLLALARDTEQWADLARYVGRPELTVAEMERARALLIASGARDSVVALAENFRGAALHTSVRLPPAATAVVNEVIDQILPDRYFARSVGVA